MSCVQSVQKFLTNAHFLFRRHVGQRSGSSRCMHTLWCLLVSAGVPRMRLCSSFYVVQHSTCDPEVNAACVTDEVVQFFVCCGTFCLSVGLLFYNMDLVFLRTCLFRRLVRNFSFEQSFRRLKFETTSFWRTCRYPYGFPGVRAYGCVGVWVSFSLFMFVCLCLPALGASLPALGACLPACLCPPACLPLPALGACLPASDAYLPASCACRPASGACEMNETLNQVPRGYGNDVPVDCGISHHQL